MKIIVYTKHSKTEWDYMLSIYRPIIKNETFTFEYNQTINTLRCLQKPWLISVNDLDDALNKIKAFFAGGNYQIVDLKAGVS